MVKPFGYGGGTELTMSLAGPLNRSLNGRKHGAG
ncbi:hypothetical protein FHS42_005988 [Streptomyces zagrosensis]|uniref:Uncharacterized protein n=1 Tax=Streptomyces zagrosensis TaxID=1042984 RepID=A0A7W9V1F5_9ACTN|nr:hypothetical protein [Streptomyces zagrosensis]